jgi:hypothetical protein
MLEGLPNGCPEGTSLEFSTGGGELSLNVDGKAIGSVASEPLAIAFADMYCGKNAVCKLITCRLDPSKPFRQVCIDFES